MNQFKFFFEDSNGSTLAYEGETSLSLEDELACVKKSFKGLNFTLKAVVYGPKVINHETQEKK